MASKSNMQKYKCTQIWSGNDKKARGIRILPSCSVHFLMGSEHGWSLGKDPTFQFVGITRREFATPCKSKLHWSKHQSMCCAWMLVRGERGREDMQPLYLSCIVEQVAATTVCVFGITWRETPLPNQYSLLVTKTLHVRVLINISPGYSYIQSSLLKSNTVHLLHKWVCPWTSLLPACEENTDCKRWSAHRHILYSMYQSAPLL